MELKQFQFQSEYWIAWSWRRQFGFSLPVPDNITYAYQQVMKFLSDSSPFIDDLISWFLKH